MEQIQEQDMEQLLELAVMNLEFPELGLQDQVGMEDKDQEVVMDKEVVHMDKEVVLIEEL